jgi:hypothetical protein
MAATEDKYIRLICKVFQTDQGQELMEAWQLLYGDRASYMDGIPTEEVLVREGERRFFLVLKSILQQEAK